MAKIDVSFNFGANAKRSGKAGGRKKPKQGGRSNAWAAYVSGKRKR
jgi:hypothetical protein